jgi:hypothetical protein
MQYPVLNTNSIAANISETKAKIPLLIKGNWHVPGYGVMKVTDSYIDTLKENYKSNVLGFKPYATLGHPTDSPDPASIDGQRKRGDLEDIIVEDNIVYGVYDINEETYNLIKNGDYEYSSPEISQNFRDKVSGKLLGPTLLRTALTNAPFMPFNENKSVLLSSNVINDSTNNDIISPICIKLSTTITSNNDDIVNTVSIIDTNDNKATLKEQLNKEQDINMSTTEPEVKVTPEAVSAPSIDIEAILAKVLASQTEAFTNTVNGITAKFDESVSAITAKTSETVAALTTELNSIKGQVATVLTKAEDFDKTAQYVTNLSSSDRARQLNSKLNGLFQAGVTPAAIQLTKSLIENEGNSIVKLSVSGKDTDVTFEDALIQLVKLSSNVVNEAQEGSLTTAVKTSYLDQVIEANKVKIAAKKAK